MAYWLDADIFITAKNSLYAFEIHPSFWAWLDGQLQCKNVKAPQRVFAEIRSFKKDDPLKQWATARIDSGMCVEPDKKVSESLSRIANHLYTSTIASPKTKKPQQRYKSAQIEVFSRGADAFVIAHAMADKGTVVTFESTQHPDSQRIRIPDVCADLKVPCINLVQMLFALKAQL